MRDVLIPGPDLETWRAGVDQERADEFTLAARGLLLTGGGKQDHEVRMVGVTDEVLGAVDDEVAAPRQCRGLHAAQVRARLRLAHRQALGALAAHRRQQVALALCSLTGEQDVRGPRDAGVVQHVTRIAELLLVQHPAHRIEPGATDLGGHVGGVQAGGDRPRLEFLPQLLAQPAALFDLALVRHQLAAHEFTRGCDDQLLFFGERKVHRILLTPSGRRRARPAGPQAARVPRPPSARPSRAGYSRAGTAAGRWRPGPHRAGDAGCATAARACHRPPAPALSRTAVRARAPAPCG